MSRSFSSFSAGLSSTALATGDSTTTSTTASTAAWSGTSVAYGTAVALAQDASIPHTSAATGGFASGGDTSTAHTATWSVDYPYGSNPVSVDVSVTGASSYGHSDALSGYGLTSPSLHGLL
jgi:hypothetical protein